MATIYKNLLITTSVVISYLIVEWIYNQHLLVLLSYDYINPDDFQFTEIFGKFIASFGLNLIINSAFKKFKLYRFLIGVGLGYAGLTFLFNYAVNAFPNDFRYSSYYSMMYRKDVVNQNDNLEILKFTNDNSWYEKSIVLSQFVYVLKDEQWRDFEKKIKEPINKKINKLHKNRIQYFKDYKKFNDSYAKIINAWGRYGSANAHYNAYKGFLKGDAKKKFIKKVGLPPDLSLDEFIKKSAPEYTKYANTKLFDGNEETKVSAIYTKDLPKNMNESEFNTYLDKEIIRISAQVAPEINNIRDNKNSFDTLAILVIPPISICLSLFSILLNILILLAKWSYVILELHTPIFVIKKKFFKLKKISFALYFSLFISFFVMAICSLANTTTTLTETNSYWSNIREINHKEHPILFTAFSIGIKIEPIICFTQNEPKFIKQFTDHFYHK